ncbi:hypothetical protein GCM10027341_18140 [Spirosoma knui]
MKTTTYRALVGLLLTLFFAACSRPVAYLQKAPREQFTTAQPQVTAPVAEAIPAATPADVTPTEQIAQATAALDQIDALVRNDSKLAANKTLQKRMNRARTMLATASTNVTLTPDAATAPRKANLMERMVLKKLDKKLSKRLAPANPDKAMASTGILAAGAVVVIVGLILLLTGAGSGVGVILLLAGAVILLVGLL